MTDQIENILKYKKKPWIVWVVMIFILLGGIGLIGKTFYDNYQLDTMPEARPEAFIATDLNPGFSKRYIAEHMLKPTSRFVNYISNCKRFPKNIEDMYRKHDDDSEGCRPFSIHSPNPMLPYGGEVWPWIDPWGRPYQIRYDRERRKLQVRSRGRYVWLESDDIQAETTWGTARTHFDKEIKKCDRGEACIFDRGWH